MFRPTSFAAVVVLLFAGCTGPDAAGQAPAATINVAPEPAVNESYGAITGSVVDEEQQPIEGATVVLIELRQNAVTDAAGRFTFNGLEFGTYSVFAELGGYVQAGRKAEVRPGETTTVSLIMKKLVIPEEPYHRSVPKTGFIHVGHAMVSWVVNDIGYVNVSALNPYICEPCQFVLHYEPGPKQIYSEAIWPAGNPGINQDVWLAFYKARPGVSSNYAADKAFYLKSRGAVNWTNVDLAKFTADKMHMHLHGGLTTVNVEHKVDVWNTYAYRGYLPDGFMALPPP